MVPQDCRLDLSAAENHAAPVADFAIGKPDQYALLSAAVAAAAAALCGLVAEHQLGPLHSAHQHSQMLCFGPLLHRCAKQHHRPS